MKVFLRYYVELGYPAEKVDEALNRMSGSWLERAAREANLRGLLMLRDRGSAEDIESGGGKIALLITPAAGVGNTICRSVTWIAGNASRPILRGDLELAELGPARTQLALSAQYQPFNQPASVEDRMEAQRVGESTLKAFVDRIAACVEAILGGADAQPKRVQRNSSGGLPQLRPSIG